MCIYIKKGVRTVSLNYMYIIIIIINIIFIFSLTYLYVQCSRGLHNDDGLSSSAVKDSKPDPFPKKTTTILPARPGDVFIQPHWQTRQNPEEIPANSRATAAVSAGENEAFELTLEARS